MIEMYVRHCVESTNSAHKKNRPSWFSREACFNNLVLTSTDDVHITCVLDGKLEDHFLSDTEFRDKVTVVSHNDGGNDARSFLALLEIVEGQDLSDDQIVYLCEDDYIHDINWSNIMLDGFTHTTANYITLYDHNDKYWLPGYQGLQSQILATQLCHWRTTPSTTNTYAARMGTFRNHMSIHKQFCDLNEGWTKDHVKFLTLWKDHAASLISSIPGYSTHCENEYMSPIKDWDEVMEFMKIGEELT